MKSLVVLGMVVHFLKQVFIIDLLGAKHDFYEVRTSSSWPQKLGPQWSVLYYQWLSLLTMRLCHQQIGEFSGGPLWCSTWTASSSAAGLCIWYVHVLVSLGPLPDNRTAGQSLKAPQTKGARWPRVAEVQLVREEASCFLFFSLLKDKMEWCPFYTKIANM